MLAIYNLEIGNLETLYLLNIITLLGSESKNGLAWFLITKAIHV